MLEEEDIAKRYSREKSRLDIRKYVFAKRIVDKWNVLPDSCMECTTLNDFKIKNMWGTVGTGNTNIM